MAGPERLPRRVDQAVEVLGDRSLQRQRFVDPDQVADRDALVEQRSAAPAAPSPRVSWLGVSSSTTTGWLRLTTSVSSFTSLAPEQAGSVGW